MNFWKKFFAGVVAAGMGLLVFGSFVSGEAGVEASAEAGAGAGAEAGAFYEGAIDFLVEKGVVDGYADGSFRPEQAINRAEFVKIVTELQGLDSEKLQSSDSAFYKNCFSDVGGEWFAPFVCYGKKAGIVNGYDDGSFKPGQGISFVEALKVIYVAQDVNVEHRFSEVSKQGEWYVPYLEDAMKDGIYFGWEADYGRFITRGETAELIYRFLDKKGFLGEERVGGITDYVVYYGDGRVEDLGEYDLAIIQPETLTKDEVAELKSHGTMVVAYLSVGEAEPYRPWFNQVDEKWLLGSSESGEAYFVDANQSGWQDLMAQVTGEFIDKGYDGVFLDTVGVVDVYPQTKQGMIQLIHNLRETYPHILIIQNRGFAVLGDVATDIDAVMFENLSTEYDSETDTYVKTWYDNEEDAEFLVKLKEENGIVVLALDYAAPSDHSLAEYAIGVARGYGFIPSVSVIGLDDIPSY